jgi:hypothetical protein
MPANRFHAFQHELADYFGFLKTEYSFTVASGANALCDDRRCRAVDGSTFLFLDNNHLTEAGALRLMPFLQMPLLNPPAKDNPTIAVSAPLLPAAESKALQ